MGTRPATRSAHPAPRIRVGCSGWQYKSWRGLFYPPDLPASRWLEHYTSVFDSAEINTTFYGLPTPATVAGWRSGTPPDFLAAVKASRYLTHLKRLREPEDPLARFFGRVLLLGRRLGPVLYQLPATMRHDLPRLRGLLDALPRRSRDVPPLVLPDGTTARRPREVVTLRHVIEFRDPSWYRDDVFKTLEEAGVALCLHDKTGSAFSSEPVGPFVYVRFHGTSGHYSGSYSSSAMRSWATRLLDAARAGRDCYAYFNNDIDGAAVGNARELRERVGIDRPGFWNRGDH